MYTIVYVAINRDVAKRSKRSKAGVHAIQALMPFMFIVSNMGAVSVRSVQSTVVLHQGVFVEVMMFYHSQMSIPCC